MIKKKNKKVIYGVLIAQMIFLLATTLHQIQPRESIILSDGNFVVSAEGREDENGIYVDHSYEGSHKKILSDSFLLDRGVYNVTVHYETNNVKGSGLNGCWSQIIREDRSVGYLESGKGRLLQNFSQMNYRVHVHADELSVQVENGIDDNLPVYLLVREIKIEYCNLQSTLHDGILLVTLFACFDIILWLIMVKKEYTKKFLKENALTIVLMAGAMFIASMPLMQERIGEGLDLRFHMHRIYEIAESIKAGYFPVYIMPDWMNGYGYASGIYYGDTFMYLPALLYLSGFSLATAYKFFIVYMNVVTLAIAYFSLKKIGGNQKIVGAIASSIYVVGLFRLINIYQRAVVGEWTAMAFFPLLLLGFWEIYYKENTKKTWIYIVLGTSGLISTHLLSTILAFITVLFFMLFAIKKTLKKDILRALLKALAGVLLVNAYFIVPFLDSFVKNDIITVDLGPLYQWSAYIGQIFSISYQEYTKEVLNGMYMEMPISIGITSLCIMGIAIYILLIEEKKAIKLPLGILTLIFIITVIASTNIFPYKWIYKNLAFLTPILRILQFPYRWLGVSTVMIAAITTVVCSYAMRENKKVIQYILIVVVMLSYVHGARYVSGYMSQAVLEDRIYDHDESDSYDALSYGEYTLLNLGSVDVKDPIVSDGNSVSFENYVKDGLKVKVDVVNITNQEQFIDIPLQCYFGYKAYGDNGMLTVVKSDEARIRVIIPANYRGNVNVKFEPPFYWTLANMISLLAFLFIVKKGIVKKSDRVG
ncbi:MAG: hypothetical protein IKW30_10155 [Lachnospiraceae bacterium]|nr:hypothetical protein [Lachnospiraceae bacterium]